MIDTEKVELLNPKIHTRIDPASGTGPTLDIALVTHGLRKSVVHFKVDTRRLHDKIMKKDNKEKNKLEYKTYETDLARLNLKDKKMYKLLTKSGEQFQYAMFKYYKPLINNEQVPETYNYTKLLVILSYIATLYFYNHYPIFSHIETLYFYNQFLIFYYTSTLYFYNDYLIFSHSATLYFFH